MCDKTLHFSYAEKLEKEAKVRYKEKIALIQGFNLFVGNVTEGEQCGWIKEVKTR